MLIARHLCLERHFEPVFQPLSLEVGAGELLVVTGANGSGKTTLIRMLAGLIAPTSGSLERGKEPLIYIGHDSAVKAELTVRENITFSARLAGAGNDIEPAIEEMGLKGCADQAGGTLSAGQRKRTALARLILVGSGLWLLDEPYTNLDARGVEWMDAALDQHLANGGACVMATHGAHRPGLGSQDRLWRMSEINLDASALAA
jgi:heme exporter protein A